MLNRNYRLIFFINFHVLHISFSEKHVRFISKMRAEKTKKKKKDPAWNDLFVSKYY